MALPATDSFTTGATQDLDVYSASWTINSGNFKVDDATDACCSDNASSYDHFAHWNADAFNDNQYAQVTIGSSYGGIYPGPAARVAASAQTGYEWCGDTVASYLVEVTAGSANQLGNDGAAWGSAFAARIEASGTTITPKIDGAEEDPPGAQTDSSITSGSAGVCGGGGFTNLSRMDDWEGGNLTLIVPEVSVSDTLTASDTPTASTAPTLQVAVWPGLAAYIENAPVVVG